MQTPPPSLALPSKPSPLPTPQGPRHFFSSFHCVLQTSPSSGGGGGGYAPFLLLTALAWLCGNQLRVLIFPKKPFKKQHTEFFMAYVRVLVSKGGWGGKERLPFVSEGRS